MCMWALLVLGRINQSSEISVMTTAAKVNSNFLCSMKSAFLPPDAIWYISNEKRGKNQAKTKPSILCPRNKFHFVFLHFFSIFLLYCRHEEIGKKERHEITKPALQLISTVVSTFCLLCALMYGISIFITSTQLLGSWWWWKKTYLHGSKLMSHRSLLHQTTPSRHTWNSFPFPSLAVCFVTLMWWFRAAERQQQQQRRKKIVFCRMT